MSSKITLLIFTGLLFGCGVKAPPMKYPETVVDSYVRGYTGSDPTPEEIERTKNKSVIPGPLDSQQKPIPAAP